MKHSLRSNLPLFFANGSVYGLNSLYYCFIQIYIGKYHPENTAGVLLAIGPFVAIFAPILWGLLADTAKSKNRVLTIAVIGSALFYFLLMFNQSFWYLAVMLVFVMFFMSPFGGLVDIITLEYTTENHVPYGPIRITGTVVFGLIPLLLTGFTDRNINVIFFAYLAVSLIASASVMASPRVAGHGTSEHRPSILTVMRDGRLMLIFIIIAISQFSWAYYLNFFPGHLTGTLGQSQQIWGINTFISVLGEIPFFFAFNYLFDKIGMKKLILYSSVVIAVRHLCLALVTNIPALLGVGLLTGFAFTVFTYCGSVYITHNVAPENRASANSLMYALCNGIPKVLAGVLGGVMTAGIGYTASMLTCSALNVAAIVIYFAALARDRSIT